MFTLIKAYWHGFESGPNFGDHLTPILIKSITGEDAIYAKINDTHKLLCVGSIVEGARTGDVVWGAGSINKHQCEVCQIKDVTFIMVRGPLTQEMLRSRGAVVPLNGSPVSLLPYAVDTKNVKKTRKMGIVPNTCSLPSFPHLENVIDINSGVLNVCREIAASETILSESLHALVFAESLEIPAVPMWAQDGEHAWKFEDYFLSTGRSLPPPLWWDAIKDDLQPVKDALNNWKQPVFKYKEMLACCPFNIRKIKNPEEMKVVL